MAAVASVTATCYHWLLSNVPKPLNHDSVKFHALLHPVWLGAGMRHCLKAPSSNLA